jgi:hypothetical protein
MKSLVCFFGGIFFSQVGVVLVIWDLHVLGIALAIMGLAMVIFSVSLELRR